MLVEAECGSLFSVLPCPTLWSASLRFWRQSMAVRHHTSHGLELSSTGLQNTVWSLHAIDACHRHGCAPAVMGTMPPTVPSSSSPAADGDDPSRRAASWPGVTMLPPISAMMRERKAACLLSDGPCAFSAALPCTCIEALATAVHGVNVASCVHGAALLAFTSQQHPRQPPASWPFAP